MTPAMTIADTHPRVGRQLGLSAGLAFTAPFLLDFLPFTYVMFVYLPLLALAARHGRERFRLSSVDWIVWPLLAIILGYLLGLKPGDASFHPLAREIVIASSLLGVYFIARWTRADLRAVSSGFLGAITLFTLVLALLSTGKMYLQERGILFTPLTTCSLGYPGGTSFCVDYNLYGLLLLLGVTGLSLRFIQSGKWLALLIGLPLLIVAGQYLGSRRFLLLFPVLMALLAGLYCTVHRRAWLAALLRLTAIVAIVCFSTIQLMRIVAAPDIAILYTDRGKPFVVCNLDTSLPGCIAEKMKKDRQEEEAAEEKSSPQPQASAAPPSAADKPAEERPPAAVPPQDANAIAPDQDIHADPPGPAEALDVEDLQIPTASSLIVDPKTVTITATAPAILNQMKVEGAYGMGSRLERWQYAVELLDWKVALRGMGFDYREKYSCRFLDCLQEDYPHLPIASALLYGGIGFALFALLYYLAYISLILKAGREGLKLGTTIIAGLTLPYVFISGDSILSLPHGIAAGLLMALTPIDPLATRALSLGIKRIVDICASAILLIVLSPVMLVVALASRRFLGPGVLFVQERPGRHGRPFAMVKFRTMLDKRNSVDPNAPDVERLTHYGKVLRATSLDELPELWNVLKGDMSLVGPRPLLMEYLPLYSAEQSRRHNVRPGITGWAQVNGRNAIDWETKLALDVWYVDHRSLMLDLRILWKTVAKVIGRSDITSGTSVTTEKFTGQNKS